MSAFRRLVKYLYRYRWRYAAGLGCLFLAAGCSLGIPWTVKSAVDVLRRHDADARLDHYVWIILLLAIGHGLARLGSRFAILGAGQWVEHDIRNDLYAHFQTLPPTFYHRHRTGDLMSRASNDISALRALAGFGCVMLAGTTLTFIGTISAMWWIDPWLMLYAMSPFPLLVLVAKRSHQNLEDRSLAVQEQLGVLSTKVQENLTGMTVVRAYTMEERETAEFERLNRQFLDRSVALARTQAISWPLMGLISGLGALIVLWLGGKAVMDGRISLGAFVAFNGYLAQLAWPTIALGWTLGNIRRGLTAMRRVAEVLAARPVATREAASPVEEGADPAEAYGLPAGDLEFRALSFSYEGRTPALSNVSFRVPEGGMVAVVGPTGSGKSTLGLLLCRLFDPPPGTVFLGGVDVHDLPLGTLRRSVGYVPQEAFLFSRSLRDNVRLADETADDPRVRSAAEFAGLDEDVQGFAHGWDTVVGERGLTLSGGQRQRVALARALIGNPPYLVLDDVLASVDAGKEWEILRSLRDALRGRTTLVMTHRLRAAQEADWVVVLDEGQVVEQGRHPDLLSSGGLYARLWRVQQLEDELARA
ncbi:MAG TPA: ABC transporter ATP-binding protein [Candidatus Methylomirabilis sp.]|nr:ABC transporter ATP-binding protein [Candidatus Methylomirabilis sp.]